MIRVTASEVSPPASTKVEMRSKGESDEERCADGNEYRQTVGGPRWEKFLQLLYLSTVLFRYF